MKSTSGSNDQFLSPKKNELFLLIPYLTKTGKQEELLPMLLPIVISQIFHINKPNYTLCLITTLMYQLGYISAGIYQLKCHEMCRGFTGTNDGCHEALVLFQKATELETSFLRSSTFKLNFFLTSCSYFNHPIWMHAAEHSKCYLKLRQFSIFKTMVIFYNR